MLRNQPVPDLGIVLLDRGYVLVSERGDYRDQLAFETVDALLVHLRSYLEARERSQGAPEPKRHDESLARYVSDWLKE